jgi:putative ABC transport system permease protein
MNYLQHKDLGYKKDQVIIVPTSKKRAEAYPLARLYKIELSKYPEVLGVSASIFSFSETPWVNLGYSDDKKNYHSFQYNEVGRFFLSKPCKYRSYRVEVSSPKILPILTTASS